MVELIKAYEADYSKYLSAANKKLSALSQGKPSEAALAEVSRDIKDAEHWLKQMENQMYSLSAQQSAQYQKRLQRYNENLRNAKRTYDDELNKKGKVELFGKAGYDSREKLLTTNEILQESGDTLEETLKIGIESEEIAIETVNNLKKQRGQILGINEKVNDVGTNVTKANRTISTMDKRRIVMKLMMMATIVLLVIAFCICLYMKLG
jgi:vesicle transport through interaction with t-SNAREs 1